MTSGAIPGPPGRRGSEAGRFPASSGKRTKTAKSGFVEAFHDADGPAASRWQRTNNNTATTHWSGGGVFSGRGWGGEQKGFPPNPPPFSRGGGVGVGRSAGRGSRLVE